MSRALAAGAKTTVIWTTRTTAFTRAITATLAPTGTTRILAVAKFAWTARGHRGFFAHTRAIITTYCHHAFDRRHRGWFGCGGVLGGTRACIGITWQVSSHSGLAFYIAGFSYIDCSIWPLICLG